MSDQARGRDGKAMSALRAALLGSASKRRDLLAKMPELEVKLFVKDGEGVETKIRYVDLDERLKRNSFPEGFKFQSVDIVKPSIPKSCANEPAEGVDNTGLLRLYPSEEVLAVYMLLRKEEFIDRSILELGAGFCGLSGLIFAKNVPETKNKIVLSDGNLSCLQMLQQHIKDNDLETRLETELILWDRHGTYEGVEQYDNIIISDCLYLNRIHPDLLQAIYCYLKDDGRCIILSPPRYKSLDFFVQQAQARFHVRKSTEEIAFIDHIRDEATKNFRPYFLEMRKIVLP